MSSPANSGPSRVHFVTLGCPKNRVDSELLIARMLDAELVLASEPEDADVIVVNTCGFIEDAKKESIDVIFEMARHKAHGRAKKLVVAGCLVQRYSEELAKDIPEIDVLLGNGEYDRIAEVAKSARGPRVLVSEPRFLHDATTPRVNTFLPHSAYVKVAEGCDQKCAFCIIPKLRGLARSRPVADVVREAEELASRGIVELNLVAQDLTGYGFDLSPKASLADLVYALGEVRGIEWVRLHYAYPRPFSRKLLQAFRDVPKLVPYVDMPLQHISDPVLKRMNRGRPRRFIEELLDRLAREVPGLVLRTSFIVGFPGETDGSFEELCAFVSQRPFERVGVFKYSDEEGTSAYDLPEKIPPSVIAERHASLMTLLREKSRATMETYVGRTIDVLVDGPSEETELLLAGRHKGQAPEVDGTTYINDGEAKAGDLVEVEIEEAMDYDLVGKIVRVKRPAPSRPKSPRLEARPRVALPVL
ncbi:MAG: 30S ribosomal protein S12 methylthiotransferase RimO [Deltaproteobacteria bacterium]|nr:30S ribosomal protein S12 methylthiotransferase RimO [Deltaproteobacteria bacterium]